MGIRSHVAMKIIGLKDQLEFLQRYAPDLFALNDLSQDEELSPYPDDNIGLRYQLCFENDWIKWYTAHSPLDYPETAQFKLIWRLAEKWGLDGKVIDMCYEYFDANECIETINNGNALEYPKLIMRVDIGIGMIPPK